MEQTPRFDDEVALVTGAQQGIGAACAISLAQTGARVVVNYLNDIDAADGVCRAIEDLGGTATKVAADISKPADVERLFDAARDMGGLRVLVNNAGIFPRVPFLEMTDEDWDRVLNTNLRGTFLCTRCAAKQMVESSRGGAIVNLSSAAAHSAPALGVHYASSKAGLLGFTRSAAVALAPHNIRVNAVAPGLTDTAQPRDGMSEEEIQVSVAQLPLGRMATPEDIADAVAFLASERARHITGQVLHVNGGQLFL